MFDRLHMKLAQAGQLRPSEVLATFVALASVLSIAALLITASLRLSYPFEIEWMEGGIVDHARVLLAGQPLYREPSLDFTPYVYTPLYYHVSAAAFRLLGVGLPVARLISLLSTIGTIALLAAIVRRETGDNLAAVAAAGLYASTYALTGTWFDLARVDALAVVMMMAAVYVARFGTTRWTAVAAAGLLFLSFYTKQSLLVLAAPVLAYLVLRHRVRGLPALGVFAVLVGGGVVAMNAATDGWFTFYVFRVPGQHELLWNDWASKLRDYFVGPVGVMALASIAGLAGVPFKRERRLEWLLYGCTLATAAIASYIGFLHTGGYPNVMIPAYAFMALMTGLVVGWTRRIDLGTSTNAPKPPPTLPSCCSSPSCCTTRAN